MGIETIIAIVAILICLWVFFKIENHKQTVRIIILVIIIVVVYFSIMTWFGSEQGDINSTGSVIKSVYGYIGWVGETGSVVVNGVKSSIKTVGNAVMGNKTETLPDDGRR